VHDVIAAAPRQPSAAIAPSEPIAPQAPMPRGSESTAPA